MCSSCSPVRTRTRLPLASASQRRGDVVAGVGRFPWEASAAEAAASGYGSGRGEALHAVADERARGWRVRRGQERQDEDVGVPEDVSAVAGPAQPLRAERGLRAIETEAIS